MEKMTFIQALRKVGIDRLEGQSLQDYAKEVKGLTADDKAWFAARFAAEFGFEIVQSPNANAA